MNKSKPTKPKTAKVEEAKEPTATHEGRLNPNRLQSTIDHLEEWAIENGLLYDADAETEQ